MQAVSYILWIEERNIYHLHSGCTALTQLSQPRLLVLLQELCHEQVLPYELIQVAAEMMEVGRYCCVSSPYQQFYHQSCQLLHFLIVVESHFQK